MMSRATSFAAALLALISVASVVPRSYAQVTNVTEVIVTITTSPPPSGSPTTLITSGTQTVDCTVSTMLDGEPATINLDADEAAAINGAVCWEIYSLDGGIVNTPVTFSVSEPDFSPTSISITEPTGTEVSASSSTSSSNRAIKVIMPALIGSIVGAIVLALTAVYLIRMRNRRRRGQTSRARIWAEQNRDSWAMKETSTKQRGADASGPGALAPGQTGYVFSGRSV